MTGEEKILAAIETMMRRQDAFEEKVMKRLDGLAERLDGLAERLDGLEKRLDGLEKRLDGLENRMDGLENRMDGLENRMDGLENRMGALEKRLEAVEEQAKKNHEAIVILEVRHNATRAEVMKLLDNLASAIYSLEVRVAAMEPQAMTREILRQTGEAMVELSRKTA